VLVATEFAIALLKEGSLKLAMAFSYEDLYELLHARNAVREERRAVRTRCQIAESTRPARVRERAVRFDDERPVVVDALELDNRMIRLRTAR